MYGRTASECLRRFEEATAPGVRVRPGSVSEFVVDQFQPWISSRVQPDSLSRYDSTWRNHVAPTIGARTWSELDLATFQAMLNHLPTDSARRAARALTVQIVRLAVALGHAAPSLVDVVALTSVAVR